MTDTSSTDKIWYKHWPPQVDKNLDYPDLTLAEILEETAKKHGDKKAIIFDGLFVYMCIDYANLTLIALSPLGPFSISNFTLSSSRI